MKIVMITLLIVGYLLADDSNSTKDYGTPFIEPKIYYINSTVKTGSTTTKSDAFSVGGRYGYISPSFEGFSGGTMVYTTNKIDNKDENPAKNSTSILKSNDKDSHHYIGQAYLTYKNEMVAAKVGRLEIETPLVGSNTRFLGNTYEAINIEATPAKSLKLSAIYISRANAGTISNVLPKNSPFGLVGYGVGREVGEFVSVDKYILGSNTKESTSGLYAVGMSWKVNEYIKLTTWDYYYDDILNSFYPEASFEAPIEKTKLFGSINYHIQNDVGENLMGKATNKEIDNKMLQAKLGAQYESNKLTLGYARTPSNKDAIHNGLIITPFNAEKYVGGYLTNHSGISDTTSYMTKYEKNLKSITNENLQVALSLYRIDVGKDNGFFPNQSVKANDWVFDTTYTPKQNIRLLARYGKAYDTDQLGTDKEEMRLMLTMRF